MENSPKDRAGELRMNAYYYSFSKTDSQSVNLILSAVACAGKASHHTDDWSNTCDFSYPPHEGRSPIDWIQNAANQAATREKKLVEALRSIVSYREDNPLATPDGALNTVIWRARETLAEIEGA